MGIASMHRSVFAALLVCWLVPAHVIFAQQRAPSDVPRQQYRAVLLYSTHFEADATRFELMEDLRTYLLAASNDFFNVAIRDCAASDRVLELTRVMGEVISERFARRGEDGPYEFGVNSPPECPWSSKGR